jgi:hypothetical protein
VNEKDPSVAVAPVVAATVSVPTSTATESWALTGAPAALTTRSATCMWSSVGTNWSEFTCASGGAAVVVVVVVVVVCAPGGCTVSDWVESAPSRFAVITGVPGAESCV